MSISPSTLRTHLAYSEWASRRLLDAAEQLTPEELARDFNTADRSVVGTLAHIFAADRVWIARVHGTPRASFIDPEDRDLATLQREWPIVQERWKDWAGALTGEGTLSTLSYADLKGNHWEQPAWQIVLHVVNHATQHRGQVSGFLRSMGHPPPPLDLISYYRSMK